MDDSTIDETQSKAIINALSRKFALIQGPPGTGKSYVAAQLIKILLASRDDAAMGPIICVSYTNDALDQFLEQLVSEGIENVVRVGSRCKLEILEPFKLEVVAVKSGHSKMRRRAHFEPSQLRKVTSSQAARTLENLKHSGSQPVRDPLRAEFSTAIKDYLRSTEDFRRSKTCFCKSTITDTSFGFVNAHPDLNY